MTNPVYQFLKRVHPLGSDQGGITGLETAIVLIAFVVVSSVFAFAALSTGLFTTDRAKETIHAGLSQARSTLEIRGSLLAATSGTTGAVTRLRFQVANAAAGEAIDLTPGRSIIKYTDVNQTCNFDNSSEFATVVVGTGDSDALLESGEVFEVVIPPATDSDGATNGDFSGTTPATALTEMLQNNTTPGACPNAVTGTQLGITTQFTLELIPPKGATLYLQRTTPVSFQSLENLQ
jgi:flagellin FlaB